MRNEAVRLADFVFDAETNVFVHPGQSEIAYSDGDLSEQHVWNVISAAQDRGIFSEELAAGIRDWPTEYHLSQQRHNLLRHLRPPASARVLELGAGCGSITRQLGEWGCQVDAVEGSQFRAKCAAARCEGLENVRVFRSNFQDAKFEPVYDIVTLIGVLGFSPMFLDGDDPMLECLKMARAAMRPEGCLILAIENQLGLKYLAGMCEDHVGKPYYGVHDLYGPGEPKTLGKRALNDLLVRAGFHDVQFQYPFPDYKVPSAILVDESFETPGFRPAEVIRQMHARDYTGGRHNRMTPDLVWHTLLENGLLRDLANSFLVFAGPGAAGLLGTAEKFVTRVYSIGRMPAFKISTTLSRGPDGGIIVRKDRLVPESEVPTDSCAAHSLQVDPYFLGDHLENEMTRCLYRGDWAGLNALIEAWLDYFVQHGMRGQGRVWDAFIDPAFIDCVPHNIIVDASGFHYIDREWSLKWPVRLRALVYRALFYFIEANQDWVFQYDSSNIELMNRLLEPLGLTFDNAARKEFTRNEITFNAAVLNRWSNLPRFISSFFRERHRVPAVPSGEGVG